MAQSQTKTMVDDGVLAAIGAVIVGFGTVAFTFRIQRELELRKENVRTWIPWADGLLIGIVTVTLLFVLFPIALAGSASRFWGERLPAAACSASTLALVGYIPALLAHYHIGSRLERDRWVGSRLDRFGYWLAGKFSWFKNEYGGVPAERAIVALSGILGVVAAVASVVVTG